MLIGEAENTIFVSTVTLWEIRLKESIGKLQVPTDFSARLADEFFEILPLMAPHTSGVLSLPWIHRDPFDRMLIAPARAEKLTLLTADDRVGQYGDFVQIVR